MPIFAWNIISEVIESIFFLKKWLQDANCYLNVLFLSLFLT